MHVLALSGSMESNTITTLAVAEATTTYLRFVKAWNFHSDDPLSLSPNAHLETVDALLLDLQEAVQQARRIRARVAAGRNAETAIGRLPVELLQKIFEHHSQLSEYMQYSFRKPRKGQPDLQKVPHPAFIVSYVCARWRTVALGHPSLWSCINALASSSRLLDVLCERARDHPLTVTYMIRNQLIDTHIPHAHIVQFISNNLYRTKDLTLRLTDRTATLGRQLEELVSTVQAPVLERCAIQCGGEYSHQELNGLSFGGCTPRLQHLEFHATKLRWHRALFSDLTSLVITHSRVIFMDEREVRLALKASPGLELMELQARFQTNKELLNIIPEPPVDLPHLHTIKLAMTPVVTHALLPSIHAPSVRLLEVDLGIVDVDVSAALLYQRVVLPAAPLFHVTRLVVEVNVGEQWGGGRAAIEGFDRCHRSFLLKWHGPRNSSFDAQTLLPVLHDILHRRARTELVSLALQSDCDIEGHPLDALIPFLHVLPHITLKGAIADRVGTYVLNGVKTQPNSWLLLEELVFEQCSLPGENIKSLLTQSCLLDPGTRLRVALVNVTVEAESPLVADTLQQLIRDAQRDGTALQCNDVAFRCHGPE